MGNFWATLAPSRPGTETAGLLQEGREEAPQDLGLGGSQVSHLEAIHGHSEGEPREPSPLSPEEGQLPGWSFM